MRFFPFVFTVVASTVATASTVPDPGAQTARFLDACDGSAAASLSGKLIAVANDEDNVLRTYRLSGGKPLGTGFDVGTHLRIGDKDEADIEAAATKGDITYWITSHGRNRNAKERPARRRFFATTWNGTSLAPAGRARHDVLAGLLADPQFSAFGLVTAEKMAPEAGGINIEGLADGPGTSLLIGFRSPLVKRDGEQMALIVPLLDARAALDTSGRIAFGAPILLDLGGRGIRSIERRSDGRYGIVAGPVGDVGSFAVFVWSGRGDDRPVAAPVTLGDLSPEGAVFRGDGRLLLFSDDGTDACKAAPASEKSFRVRVVMLP